ncbi:putative exosome complex component rrp40 [Vitis vinifera]|uniref:Putative exosome complex component rrp40 n=1 Tax=Vitis vinifera TaxID=29760 RepID=A0A438KB85_VITVI|nr:putative exosome complex component rrp40 [Vitis vinifera]
MEDNKPASFVDQLVVPGDVVLDLSKMGNQTIKLGGGLHQHLNVFFSVLLKAKGDVKDCDAITVTKAGRLRFSKPNKYWVESSQKRYVPCVEDTVLGIVVDSKADNFLVDIKGPALAFLPVLAFEGGTRRNIPKFEAGTLLYVRVVKANTGMNPELSCTDVGKQQSLAPLKTATCLSHQQAYHELLQIKMINFEVNASSPSTVILVANAIMNSESLSVVQQKIMVDKLLQRIQ